LLLAFTLATLYGAGFHLWQGGGARRLALYLLAGWLGFTLGQIVGDWLHIGMLKVGSLQLLTATLGSGLSLVLAHWLATNEAAPERK
jgi:hypothetical protein